MRRLVGITLSGLALVGLLLLPACGGEGGATEPSGESLTVQAAEPSASSANMTSTPPMEAGAPTPMPTTSNETAYEPVDVEDLEAFIPAAPTGWERGLAYGWRCDGAPECSHTDAYGSYAATEDCEYATLAIVCFDRSQTWPEVTEWESEWGYTRSVDVEGYPAMMTYWGSECCGNTYAYSVYVGPRIHVQAIIVTEDEQTADGFVRMIDYGGLAALGQ